MGCPARALDVYTYRCHRFLRGPGFLGGWNPPNWREGTGAPPTNPFWSRQIFLCHRLPLKRVDKSEIPRKNFLGLKGKMSTEYQVQCIFNTSEVEAGLAVGKILRDKPDWVLKSLMVNECAKDPKRTHIHWIVDLFAENMEKATEKVRYFVNKCRVKDQKGHYWRGVTIKGRIVENISYVLKEEDPLILHMEGYTEAEIEEAKATGRAINRKAVERERYVGKKPYTEVLHKVKNIDWREYKTKKLAAGKICKMLVVEHDKHECLLPTKGVLKQKVDSLLLKTCWADEFKTQLITQIANSYGEDSWVDEEKMLVDIIENDNQFCEEEVTGGNDSS